MLARCSYVGVVLALLGWVCLPGSRASAQQREPDDVAAEQGSGVELEIDEDALEEAGRQAIRLLQAVDSQSSSWIGLALAPADETLRAQLGLDEGNGVVVTAVVEESPAAKAGIRKHDILVAAGDSPVGEAADLVKAVEAAGEKPIAITVLRGGEKTTLEVTPEKGRPTQSEVEIEIGGKDGLVLRNLEYLVRPGAIVQTPLRLDVATQRRLAGIPNLPENLSITITKTGKQPTQIVVKRDDEKWEVTEEQLDELPEDVRPHVDRMLGRPPRISLNLGKFQPQARRAALKERRETLKQSRETLKQRLRVREPKIALRRSAKADTQQRLDALSNQLEQLQKAIEELRSSLPDDADAEQTP